MATSAADAAFPLGSNMSMLQLHQHMVHAGQPRAKQHASPLEKLLAATASPHLMS
jgi:hypothetical protein